MVYNGWEPGVVAVVFGLTRTIGIHLKERLGKNLSPVIVIPAGIDDVSVLQHGGIAGDNLVVAEAADEFSILVADVEIAYLGGPAVSGADTTR